jgi:hypothetical protein
MSAGLNDSPLAALAAVSATAPPGIKLAAIPIIGSEAT